MASKKKEKRLDAEEELLVAPTAKIKAPAEENSFCIAQPEEAIDEGFRGFLCEHSTDAVAKNPEDDYSCAAEPTIVEEMDAASSLNPDPVVEEPQQLAAECCDDEWVFSVSSKKKKKKGRATIVEPLLKRCEFRAEHLATI